MVDCQLIVSAVVKIINYKTIIPANVLFLPIVLVKGAHIKIILENANLAITLVLLVVGQVIQIV